METRGGPGPWEAIRSTVPTREGRGVVWAASALLAGAFATGRPSLYAGASLLIALYAVAHLGAALGAHWLEATWECPDRVHAGEPFPLRILLRNRGRLRVVGIEVHVPTPGGSGPAATAASIAPGGALPLEVPVRVRRRGRRTLEAPMLAVRWPFLLAVAARPLGGEREVLAYPRRVPVPPAALRSNAPERTPREEAASALRGGDRLRGIRAWVAGDPPRSIAWKASARHGRILTREFEREDSGRAVVVLDADTRDLPLRDGVAALEQACSLAASLLLRLRSEGRSVAFATLAPGPLFLPSVGSARSLARALETLALLTPPSPKQPRRDPLDLVPLSVLRGGRVILVRAAPGRGRMSRDRRGAEVVTLNALRATFRPEVRA